MLRLIPILLSLSFLSCCTAPKETTSPPNIVFLLADDLGYGDVGFNHQKLIKTPTIDRLSEEGLVFTDFYAGAPVCGPSRSVLITGQHTGHTTIRGNMTRQGGRPGLKRQDTVYRANLSHDDFTIGQLMQQSGYLTGMVGKWHLGGFDPEATPQHRGFDQFSGWLINKPETYASTYWPDKRWRNGEMVEIPQNTDGKKGYYHTSICTDEAIDFIKQASRDEKPFMLMVNYNNPHAPLDAPDHAIYANESWPEDMKTYAAMIHYLDQSVAKITNFLKDSGLAKNTIVFFCSDNGPRSNYSDQLTVVADYFDSNGPLRGYKRDMYEGGIRTPMIAWSPGRIKPGSKSNVPGYFADVMPTLAGLAGSNISYTSDGEDLSEVILGRKNVSDPRFLYWEFHENGFEQAVRYGKWKFVKRGSVAELYDLEEDVSEQRDISGQNPEVINQIEAYLKTCRSESPFWPVQ